MLGAKLKKVKQERDALKNKLEILTKQYHSVALQRNLALIGNQPQIFANLQKELQREKTISKGSFSTLNMLGAEMERLKKKSQRRETILQLHIAAYNELQKERDKFKEEIHELKIERGRGWDEIRQLEKKNKNLKTVITELILGNFDKIKDRITITGD